LAILRFHLPKGSFTFAKFSAKTSAIQVTIVLATFHQMEQHSIKNVNNYLNTNIYSYEETSGGQSSNPYLNVVHFFNTSVY
jgi:hypothetical protein